MATVELDAGEFHYADFGDRAAMPLVLLHGMPRDHSTWAQLAPGLAALGYRVITPDLRGHGASARTSTYSLESRGPATLCTRPGPRRRPRPPQPPQNTSPVAGYGWPRKDHGNFFEYNASELTQ
jgi:pimeloyl-ACP methyl ester carboxylesterase